MLAVSLQPHFVMPLLLILLLLRSFHLHSLQKPHKPDRRQLHPHSFRHPGYVVVPAPKDYSHTQSANYELISAIMGLKVCLLIADTVAHCNGRQAGSAHFVSVASGSGPHNSQRLFTALRKEADCEAVVFLQEITSVAGRMQKYGYYRSVPDRAHATPADGASVEMH